MSDLHEHAVEVDTKIEAAYIAYDRAKSRVEAEVSTLHYAAGHRSPARNDYLARWTDRKTHSYVTLDDAIASLRAVGDEWVLSYSKTGNELVDRYEAALKARDEAEQAYYEAEQDYEGWSRFFVVPGGHIHSSLNCSTCNKGGRPTRFGWLPALSGLSEAEAVKEHGPVLCTVCFPSAPVEWTEGSLNANGEYVAPKTYCPGSNTSNYEGEIRRSYRSNYARCAECGEVVTYGNKGLRKHQAKAE